MMTKEPEWLAKSRLRPQSYGMAMAQVTYGGPRGIWLECKTCERSDVIAGSRSEEWAARPTSDAARVFRKHGWTGKGESMTDQRCPTCSASEAAAA